MLAIIFKNQDKPQYYMVKKKLTKDSWPYPMLLPCWTE